VDDNDTRSIADDIPVKENIFVVFRNENYEITKENLRAMFDATVRLKDKAKYQDFWSRYKRPPIEKYWDYIIKRRDLLVPQDVRERKGAFFTPKKWVELSQKYIADLLGENWQEEHYVWDCAAGTGNLLAGLMNKRNVFASTLDQADVKVMHDRIKNGANLFADHVFQFDFLNDAFFDGEKDRYDPDTGKKLRPKAVKSKLPKRLQDILRDPERRKKLIIYINPPYAEAGNSRTVVGTGANKASVAIENRTYEKYRPEIGKAGNELFAQFLIRIYREIPGAAIANFSTLKPLQAPNFSDFRKNFKAKLERLFLIPANTFDNVKGQFPIGFFVWDTANEEAFGGITADVYAPDGRFLEHKKIANDEGLRYVSDWLGEHSRAIQPKKAPIGHMASDGNDFQNQKYLLINQKTERPFQGGGRHTLIYAENLPIVAVYYAVRHAIKRTWINNQDQFLCPDDSWETDKSFHNDCLVFTIFHRQNRISAKEGINHWIPFTENEVGATSAFESTFMADFIAGKIKKTNGNGDLFNKPKVENGTRCRFSPEAKAVFDAGRELWRYYHAQKDINVNASLYDIRAYFQGRNEKGTMNAKSNDGKYTDLMAVLREKQNVLADKIAEKVYEHRFLV